MLKEKKKKMKFSEVKNGVNSYFKRNWTRDDMTNLDEIPIDVHINLQKVYLTLFCTMSSATFGSFIHFISVAGGKFTVLSYVASLICLYFTRPGRLNTRFLLTMLAAYSFGASLGAFTNYLFKTEQRNVLRLLAGMTMGFGNFLYGAISSRDRREIYHVCLKYCFVLLISGFASIFFSMHTALWMVQLHIVQTLFMGYVVVYSQEILYDANFRDIDFLNCTFTVFFNFPAIVIHGARVYLQGAVLDQHRLN